MTDRHTTQLRLVALFCAATILAAPAYSQDSVNVVLGERYGAGGLQRALLGSHYRDAWTTEIRLPVLDLDTFAGGLTPERMGGGHQTISLIFLGQDGRRYSFRLIDKDPSPTLPPELRDTAADDLFQDQISSSHPLGVLIANGLEDVAGVLHAEAHAYVMPDVAALGEFQDQFGGQPGTLTERPGDEEDEAAIFQGFDNIDGGNRIFRRMAESQTQRIDASAFLNARLLDVLMGDWDRHRDQWTWARPIGSERWYPIAEDRDQAFAGFDGLLPSNAHRFAREIVAFTDEYPDMYGLHHQARELDRPFLASLERPAWDSVAVDLRTKMTDQVIEDAVRRLPARMHDLDGDFLVRTLKVRRDALPFAATELYELLAVDVEVFLTDLPDEVEITSMGDGKVEVTARPAGQSDGAFFHRLFDPAETKEVRIFMGEEDDIAVVSGVGQLQIVIRVVGGDGDDEVRYESNVGHVRFYDSEGADSVTGSAPSTSVNRKYYTDSNENTPPHSGHWTMPLGSPSFSSEYGLILGVGATRYGYGFRRDPYRSRLNYSAAASTQARFEGVLAYDFYRENSSQHASIELRGSQLGLLNFYGFGNDSPGFTLPDSPRVLVSTVSLEPRYGFRIGDDVDIGLGLSAQYSSSKSDSNPFLPAGVEPEPLYGAGDFIQTGAFVDVRLDSRDVPGAPTKGATLHFRGSLSPSLFDVMETYGSLEAVGTTYLSASSAPFEPTLALRAGAKRVWGDAAPFFSAAFVGGGSSLRGYDKQRFAGDTALYGTAEVRLFLARLGFLTRGDFGVLGFADAGRVYLDGDSPEGWHPAVGGGIWLGILGRANGLSAVVASSEEGTRVHISFGMPF